MRRNKTPLAPDPTVIAETTRQLNSELLRNYSYSDPRAKLDEIKASGHRKVCQYQFQKNDIVWICRECQSDDTCVLCNECFQGSDHTGHSVYFYHSQSGGCCDCGDCSSWDPKGFCHRHGVDISDPIESVPLPLKSAAIPLTARLVQEIVEFMSYFKPDFRQEDGENSNNNDASCPSVLLLHNDDVHAMEQVQSALRACGIDRSSASKFTDDTHEDGHSLLDTGMRSELKGKMLMIHSSCVLSCRIIPLSIWENRDRIIAKINWLREIALLSDGLCRIICSHFSIETLVQLMQSDAACNRYILKHLHNMYLSLMADNVFKMAFSIAYGKSYDSIMTAQENGIACNDCALTSLSVQFLNRMSCVNYLVEKLNLFDSVANTLSRMLIKQGSPSNQLSSNIILTNRRFMAALADVKIVFAISGMSRRYMSQGLSKLLDVLTHYQWMHPQERYTTSHVEYESRDWMTAFNVYIGLFSLMETLLNWTEDISSAHMTYKPDCNLAEGCSPDILAAFPELFTVIHREHCESEESEESEESLAFLDCRSPDFRDMLPSVLCVLNNCTYRIQAWAAKDWQKIQQSAVKSMSFHLPLHRFYARVFAESCTESHLTTTVMRHIRYLQNDAIEMMDIKSSLAQFIIEPALTSMSFASQIRVGMWRRNGTVMMDQALNYSETPFCSSFRDMDLLLTQIGCASIGSKSVLRTAMEIYGMKSIFESKTLSHHSSITSSSSAFEASLLDEFLILLIWLISEGPRQPNEGQVESRLRRAIIHALASADKPFSKLIEELSFISKFHDIDTAVIRKVVNDVAESKSLNSLAMEAPKFSLRSEVWCEYDPCFPWISRSSHQVVIGIRPQAKKTRAMVIAPQHCHDFYRSVPWEILSDDLVMNLCRKVVIATLNDLTPKSSSSLSSNTNNQTNQTSHIFNFTIFSRVIQILTLAGHVFAINDNNNGNNDSGSEEHGFEQCRRKFIAFLKESIPRQLSSNNNNNNNTETMESETTTNTNSNNSNNSSFSLMEALLDLKKQFVGMMESLSEKENLYFIQWIIDKYASMDSELFQMVSSRTSSKTSNTSTMSKKASKAAKFQQSLLKSMEAAASSFKDMNIGEEDSQMMMRDMNHDHNDSNDHDDDNDEFESEELYRDEVECNLTCVVCQQQHEGHEDLAFFGFSQATKLYIRNNDYCDIRLSESPNIASLNNEERETMEPCKLHFSLCGHSIHFECFGEFFANMVYRSESQGYLLLDTSRDQFTCPLCKRISNCLFPHDAQSLRKRKKIKSNSIGNEMEASRKAPSRGEHSGHSNTNSGGNSGMTSGGNSGGNTNSGYGNTNSGGNSGYDTSGGMTSGDAIMSMSMSASMDNISDSNSNSNSNSPMSPMTNINDININWSRESSYSSDHQSSLPLSQTSSSSSQSSSYSYSEPVMMCNNELGIPLDICSALSINNNNTNNTNTISISDSSSSSSPSSSSSENTSQFLLSRRFLVGLYEPLGLTSHHSIFAMKLVETFERRIDYKNDRFKYSNININNNNNTNNNTNNNNKMTVIQCESSFSAAFEGILNGLSHTLSCYESESGDWMPIEDINNNNNNNNDNNNNDNNNISNNISNNNSGKGTDELRFFPLMIAGLTSAIRHLNLANLIELRFFRDALLNENNNVFVESDVSFSRNYRTQWLHSQVPLLALPLLDAIIAISALSNLGNHIVSIDFKYGVFKYSQWIIVAHITQLIIQEMHKHDEDEDYESEIDNEKEIYPNFNELESFFPLLLELESMVRSRSFMVLTSQLPPLLTKSQWRYILWRLCAFIRCVSLLLNRLKITNRNNNNAILTTRKPRYASQLSLEMISETLKLVEMDSFLSMNREKILNTSDKWTIKFYEYMVVPPPLTASMSMPMNTLKHSLYGPFPICAPLVLLPRLEPSYTKLHSLLTKTTGMESPAICLRCGLVLDAKGGGKITKHFRMCSGETGAAFLLQDCYLLLSFGPRACYFPSIYVDEFGEKHQINRGKPLFLDPKRFEIFRKIFAQMKVATEVTDKRSNSNRVIIMNFF